MDKSTFQKTEIYGHETIRALLQHQLKTASTAHAYLFLGPEGVGKKTVALDFARELLADPTILNPVHHPDFFLLDIKDHNTIEEVRSFLSLIAGRPVRGQKKIVILDNFSAASPAIANALLKTLEEPGPSTTIILIAARSVLPTIASRSQSIVFNRLSKQALQVFAQMHSLSVTDALLDVAAGSPGRLITLSGDVKLRKTLDLWSKKLEDAGQSPVSERLILAAELGAEDSDTIEEVLIGLLEQQRQSLKTHPQQFNAVRKTVEALELLQKNLNKKLILQRLLL